MAFQLLCPNCGWRDVTEFRYGGQLGIGAERQPGDPISNQPGPQRERWYHRLGCRRWLLAERDVRTNAVLRTAWLPGEGEPP